MFMSLHFALNLRVYCSFKKSPNIIYLKQSIILSPQAVSTQAPPASLILFSAVLEKTLALTMTGILGRDPFPSTLKYP